MKPLIKLYQWRKGSQWFEIDHKLMVEIVSDDKYLPLFKRFCKTTCCLDEHYLPTFVSMKYRRRNSNRSLTWVDCSEGGLHPAKFGRTEVTIDLLKKMRNGRQCLCNGKTINICKPELLSFCIYFHIID